MVFRKKRDITENDRLSRNEAWFRDMVREEKKRKKKQQIESLSLLFPGFYEEEDYF